jgi:hypothetical protein
MGGTEMNGKITVSMSMELETGENVGATVTLKCEGSDDYESIAACVASAMSPFLVDDHDIGGQSLIVSNLIMRLGVARQSKTIEAFGRMLYLVAGRDIDKAGIISPNWDGLDFSGEYEASEKQKIIDLLAKAAGPIPS